MSERTRGAVDERYRYDDEMESTQMMSPEDLPRRDDRRSHERRETSPYQRREDSSRDDGTRGTVGFFRDDSSPRGLVDDDVSRRAAEREERARMLGVMSREGLGSDETLMPVAKPKRTTDKWHGSMALFLLRLVVAGLMGLAGYQHLTHVTRTKEFFANSVLPQPEFWAWGVIIAELAIALLLVLGLLTRVAGLGVVAVAVVLVAFFEWGTRPLVVDSVVGLTGQYHVLLAAVGMVFALLGAGGWGIDRAFRHSRDRAKQRRELGDPV